MGFLNLKQFARALIVAVLAFGTASTSAHDVPPLPIPTMYSAKAITGKVVDAETKAPIERVVVVAQWRIDEQFVGHERALINVMETVTDAEGNYSFPSWGPVWLPPMADFRGGKDPKVSYFRIGYWPRHFGNGVVNDIGHRTTPLGDFVGNGKTIELRRWSGENVRNYERDLDVLAGSMPTEGGGWRRFPRMTIEIDEVGRIVQRETKATLGQVRVDGFYPSLFSEGDKELVRRIRDER